MASTQGRQVFIGNGMFKVPSGVTRVRVIAESTAFSRFACNAASSYLLDANGQIWAWGTNTNGQLGVNDVVPRSSPVAVVGGQKFVNMWVPKTNSTPLVFAIDQNGQLYSWGQNGGFPSGQLGQNQAASAFACSSPILVAGSGVGVGKIQYANFFPGFGSYWAIDVSGNAWAWGNNASGALGVNSATTAFSSPVLVAGGIKWQMIDAENGFGTTYGIDVDNNLWAWGSNGGGFGGFGLLGTGLSTALTASSPIRVAGNNKWRKVLSSQINVNNGIGFAAPVAFAIDMNGKLWAWGNNTYGQLGMAAPYQTMYSSPTLVSFPAGVQIRDIVATVSASSADAAFLALDYNGNLWSWGLTGTGTTSGSLGNGNLGQPLGLSTPTLVVGGKTFNKIFGKQNPSFGVDFFMGIDANGAAYGWGNNGNGQLGNNGGTLNVSAPTAVSGVNRFIWLDWDSANTGPAFACDMYGQLWSWSWNQNGAAGNGTGVNTITASSPIQVLLQKVVQMNNPQQDFFFDVVPGQSIPVIFGGLYTQFADKFVGPVPQTNLPQAAATAAASPLTLIANKVTVEYDQ
jgi:alpha-tubulin suppressor-like RCC1 family protein